MNVVLIKQSTNFHYYGKEISLENLIFQVKYQYTSILLNTFISEVKTDPN